ncbi:MAG: DeoR/GlpR family DNA-binding transcription regulator [Treponema sp.]|nr:DeoR/GlpR family DNA-binding transcription regulator [Treponema sp.]
MVKRHMKILDIITRNQRVEVAVLAEMLDVSAVTVRKDLAELEEQGIIHRAHGFAVIGSLDDVGRRMAYHHEIKRRIAQAAVQAVQDGETILIESGSNCAILAEELAANRKDITMITNSAFIANHIRHARQTKIILLGGDYQAHSQVMVGSITRKCVEDFFTDKLFIGTDGFTQKYGFTGKDHMRAETVQAMARQARHVIVLTESEKFSHQGVVGVIRTEDIARVYTDDRLAPEIEDFMVKKQIQVHKVPVESSVAAG